MSSICPNCGKENCFERISMCNSARLEYTVVCVCKQCGWELYRDTQSYASYAQNNIFRENNNDK